MATKRRALSIRQPHAEAIMRGIKNIEFRSAATKVRGVVYIYAAQGRAPAATESDWLKKYGIKNVDPDDLPRGVLVGTVELFHSDGGEWYLRNPVRFKHQRKPTDKPQPVWFYPFGR